MTWYRNRSRYQEYETVEEFCARGGKVKKFFHNDYSNADFEHQIKKFYRSQTWKLLKEQVYRERTAICPVCGSLENLVVDHIQPVRHYPELIEDPNNLQILCNDCNLEKGSMINWTLEWHITNKVRLQQDRQVRQDRINRKKYENY